MSPIVAEEGGGKESTIDKKGKFMVVEYPKNKAVDYFAVVALSVKAIQELKAQNDELQSRLRELEKTVAELKAK